ncbi:dTMP kinase [Chrysiogenes arsenatis]|uniref:dTMP kinase n=1 Tax=Chrysiogenes arsenatis TaxID=309797 RepID=UPI00135F18DC|nr:dTMP kinase [Chrysiogenes arsenatis]
MSAAILPPLSRANSMAGKFICFEGPDGAGKSTQLQLLSRALEERNIRHSTTREPGGTQAAEAIRTLIFSPELEFHSRAELLLFAAARADHVANMIRPALMRGEWVLCDRFTLSTLAYQGWGRGLDVSLIETLAVLATDGCNPTLSLVLDIDPEIGLQRAQARGTGNRFDQLSLDFHQRVTEGFRILARESADVRLLDARADEATVHHAILEILHHERLI